MGHCLLLPLMRDSCLILRAHTEEHLVLSLMRDSCLILRAHRLAPGTAW
jgi:hypothetical protein